MYCWAAVCRFNSLNSSSVISSSEYSNIISCIWDESETWEFWLICSGWEPELWLDCHSNISGLAVALSSLHSPLICLGGAEGPEMTEVLFTTVARGVAALLWGMCWGEWLWQTLDSAEPGLDGSLGVPALVLCMFTSALHAVSAAVLVITSVPETLNLRNYLLMCSGTQWVGVFDKHTTHEVVVTSELEQLVCLYVGVPCYYL